MMQIRLTLIILVVMTITSCAPTTAPTTTAPPILEPSLPTYESLPATSTASPPQYETSVLAGLWDDKTRTYQILPVEPSNGQAVPGYAPIAVGVNYYHVFSPDRKTLVVIGYRSDNSSDPTLYEIDLTTWQETKTQLDGRGWAAGLAFSPDGKLVAIGLNDRESALLIIDIEEDRAVAQTAPNFEISRLKFTSDSSALMVYGQVIINRFTANEQTSGFAKVSLFDAQNLSVLWSVELEGVREGIYPSDKATVDTANLHEDLEAAVYLYPGVVFAPDRDNLYIIHADEDKVTTVDFDARSVSTVTIQPKLSWLERILLLTTDIAHAKVANGTSRSAVISPDGATIYTIGYKNEATPSTNGSWTMTQTALGLQAIDPRDGTELFRLDTSAADLRITPDGNSLLLHTWGESPSTDILNAKTLQLTSHFENASFVPAHRMNWTPLLLSSVTVENDQTHMSAYSMDGGLLGEWLANGYGIWLIAP